MGAITMGAMRTHLSLSLVSLLAGALAVGQQNPRLAPELTIHRLDGSGLRLSSYKGKVVLLALLNTGCEHCQHFAQELTNIQKDYGPKGVQVLAVVFDKEAKSQLKSFESRFIKGFPVGYSDEATACAGLG